MNQAHLVVIAPRDLYAGFRLTGVATLVADSSTEAARVIRELLSEGERGVIAVFSPLFEGLPDDLQRRLRSSVTPVVVELPSGIGSEPDDVRRTRLAQRLQRAIGYHVTFGEEAS